MREASARLSFEAEQEQVHAESIGGYRMSDVEVGIDEILKADTNPSHPHTLIPP